MQLLMSSTSRVINDDVSSYEKEYEWFASALYLYEEADDFCIGDLVESLSVCPTNDSSVGVASAEIRVSVVDMLSGVKSGMGVPDSWGSPGVTLC